MRFARIRNARFASIIVFFIGILPMNLSNSARGQAAGSAELMATYGRGVHAYFNGQANQADRLLTQVVQAGSTDPRVFYFRAIARMRMGRTYEAEKDMQIGAALEARNPGLGSTVSKSLERVQGVGRRKLEKYRRQARLQRLGEQRQKTRRRYEQLKNRESSVLRREVSIPLQELTDPGPGVQTRPSAPTVATGSAAPATDSTTTDSTNTGFDPFEDLAPNNSGNAETIDDPFSEPAQPTNEMPDDGDDIFNKPKPDSEPSDTADADPFAAAESDTTEAADITPTGDAAIGSSGSSLLNDADKVNPSKMAGILGRIVGSTMPWRGVDMPGVPIPGRGPETAEFPANDDIELGPFETDSEVIPAVGTEDNPFEESGDPGSDSTESGNEFEQADSDSADEFDDPFGDF